MSQLSTAITELRENPRQREAFEVKGHCAVLAPPGSGKTKLLTTRMAFDLSSDVIPAPQGAACITMTNAAAGELRKRMRGLGCPLRANVFVGTVHAFALAQIIGPYARAAGLGDLADARLTSEEEAKAAFDRAFVAKYGVSKDPGYLKPTMERVRRLGDYSGSQELGGPDIAELARLYERELLATGVYDFNDLMRHAVEMVQSHEWIRRALAATYPHLYIDEYQDLPPTLDELVRTLAFDEAADATLFAVGDPDQAIFGFIGTRPQLLPELADLARVTRVELDVNYRCGHNIVAASLQALGQERSVRGHVKGGDLVFEPPSATEAAQREKVVEIIRSALGEGVPHEQITVLAQAGWERDNIVDTLRAAGVAVYARDERDYRPTPVTQAIERLALYAATRPIPVEELADVLDDWQAVTRSSGEFDTVIELVALLGGTDPDGSVRQFVDALVGLGLQDLVDDPGASEDARQFEHMREAMSFGGALDGLSVEELGKRARAEGHVMASTIHGVKGLEFDIVVICDCEEGKIPDYRNTDSPIALAEEQRKFYVSVTRARKRVHFLQAASRTSKGGRVRTTKPSRFLEAMRK